MKINRRAALLGVSHHAWWRAGGGAGLIANAISNPPGSRTCADGGSCGVPNLIGTAVATDGSVCNVAGIAGGGMQSGFVPCDVAHWAFKGSGIYEGKPKVDVLRAIANLYPESFHVVARKDSGIKTIRDLKGKRVSLDEGSGIAKLLRRRRSRLLG